MRKIIILGPYYPLNGGVANASKALAEALVENGYKVHIVKLIGINSKLSNKEEINGVTIHRIKSIGKISKIIAFFSKLSSYKYQAELMKDKIKEIKPDYIIGQMIYAHGNIAGFAKKYVNCKSITYAHGEDVNQLEGVKWKEKLTIRSLINNDIILTTNSDFATILKKYTHKNIKLLPNIMKNNIDEIDYLRRIENKTFNVLCIGRLVNDVYGNDIKGFKMVIESMKKLDGCELNIIGNGPLLEDYRKYVKQNNLSNKVKFHGTLSRNETLEKMYQSNVVALPSNIEGLSMVMLEATRYGLPLIATNIGGAKDYIVDNVSGMLIERKDMKMFIKKIKYLKSNKDQYLEISKNSRKLYLENFTPERVVAKFKEVLDS